MTKFQGGTIFICPASYGLSSTHIGKAIRPLFADLVTYTDCIKWSSTRLLTIL